MAVRIEESHFLYPQVLRECRGVTTPAVWPEETEAGWTCTCGRENGPDSPICAGCGVSREWLRAHFDRTYLAARKRQFADEDEAAAEKKRKIKRRAESRGKRLTAAAVLGGAVLLLTAAVLAVTLWLVPAVRYGRAAALRDGGDYLAAADAFDRLGKDGEAAECRRLYAVRLTGLADPVSVSTGDCPWIMMTGGSFFLSKTLLEESGVSLGTSYRVPDVVDGVLVTEIAPMCFMALDELEEIVLPESVTAVGERAFYGCASLRSIVLPEKVASLGERVFLKCTALRSVTLPDGLEAIPFRAFSECASLRDVNLPTALLTVGDYAFWGCASLSPLPAGTDLSAVTVGVGNEALTDLLIH